MTGHMDCSMDTPGGVSMVAPWKNQVEYTWLPHGTCHGPFVGNTFHVRAHGTLLHHSAHHGKQPWYYAILHDISWYTPWSSPRHGNLHGVYYHDTRLFKYGVTHGVLHEESHGLNLTSIAT